MVIYIEFSIHLLMKCNTFFSTIDNYTVVTYKLVIPRRLLSGQGLLYSYCVIINNDAQHPVNEYFYDSIKWEEGQKRVLSNREELSGKEEISSEIKQLF